MGEELPWGKNHSSLFIFICTYQNLTSNFKNSSKTWTTISTHQKLSMRQRNQWRFPVVRLCPNWKRSWFHRETLLAPTSIDSDLACEPFYTYLAIVLYYIKLGYLVAWIMVESSLWFFCNNMLFVICIHIKCSTVNWKWFRVD